MLPMRSEVVRPGREVAMEAPAVARGEPEDAPAPCTAHRVHLRLLHDGPPADLPRGRAPGADQRPWAMVAATTVVVALAVVLLAHDPWSSTPSASTGGVGASPRATSAAGAPAGTASIADRTDPGLVDVEVGGAGNGAVAAGTGMVVRSSGLVVTANHVIEGASAITVTDVGNGRTYRAAVAGYDRSRDVAVLRLRGASGLRTVRLGRAPGPTVGLGVVVVGGAGRAGGTPRYAGGAVTATGQAIPADRGSAPRAGWPSGLVATDVHVVPGDSGGAVVAADGDVVGMTDVTGADQIGAAGARGYAVPAVVVRSVVDAVLSGIAPPSVHLGPTAGLGAVARSAVLAMPAVGPIPGARITSLVAGGPGAAAGLETGDLITSVGGHAVTSAESLATSLLSFSPASTVLVGYVDASGLLQSVPVQLRPGPPQ